MIGLYWHIDRWRQSSAYTDMTTEEQGLYRNLLDEATLRDGALPADERILARVGCGGDQRVWKRCREAVLRRFELVDGALVNRVLEKVITTSQKRIDRQQRYRDRVSADRHAERNADRNAERHERRNERRYQDQDQDVQERSQGRQAVPDRPAAGLPARLDEPSPDRHGGHVRHFCGWVCLPEVFIEERLPQLGGASVEDFLEWAAATERAFAGHPVDRSKPFDFWRARLAEATAGVQATPAEAQQYQNYLRAVCNAPGTPMSLANYVLRLRLGGAASGPIAPAFAPFVGISRKDRPA